MTRHRLLWALTIFNLGCLAYQAAPTRTAEAGDNLPVLRGRGLEVVDADGKTRFSVKLEPADPAYQWPDGHVGYPETVMLRLSTADGKPRIKLGTSTDGSGLMLLGDSDDTFTVLQADRKATSLKLRDTEATQKVLKP